MPWSNPKYTTNPERREQNREEHARQQADKERGQARVLVPPTPNVDPLSRARALAKADPVEAWDEAKVAAAMLTDPTVAAKDADRLRACEMFGRAAGAFIDRVEHSEAAPLRFRGFGVELPVIDGRVVEPPTLPAPRAALPAPSSPEPASPG